ncbi:MAG: type II toxin-antitoxin system VapC family toxin, partial [Thiotrichales bacterium]|nr:type II toxin-antitoxin system VapC family toxin [Thiotrichales bacterium]
ARRSGPPGRFGPRGSTCDACFASALTGAGDEPLLFKGNDFSLTDVATYAENSQEQSAGPA